MHLKVFGRGSGGDLSSERFPPGIAGSAANEADADCTDDGAVDGGGDPGTLVGEADSLEAVSGDEDHADDDTGSHFDETGENGDGGVAESLYRHAADIEDTQAPVEEPQAEQVSAGEADNVGLVGFDEHEDEEFSKEHEHQSDEGAVADTDWRAT